MVRVIRRLDDGSYRVTDTKVSQRNVEADVADLSRITAKVLSQLDDHKALDVESVQTTPSVEKQKKSLSLVWPTIISTALVIGMGVLFAKYDNEQEAAPVDPESDMVIDVLPDIPRVDDPDEEIVIIDDNPSSPDLSTIRPQLRPAFLEQSLVIPHDALAFYEIDQNAGYVANGCGAQRGFDEFWIGGLDQTPFFQNFVDDYRARLQLPEQINDDSLRQHRYLLQIMLGMNECYESVGASTYDADIGPATQAALMAFQSENGLEQTGEADPETLSRLVHASAMRVMFNMHVLEMKAREFALDPIGIFQKAWHESYYSHMAVSATGADGIGQFIEMTFLDELRRLYHPLYDEYHSIRADGGDLSELRQTIRDMQYDVWINAHLMMRYCDRLLDRFNEASCADIYGAYQLGENGYQSLINAASRFPDQRASLVTRGTVSNGYGHMRAADALSHVRGLIQNDSDHERAVRDLRYLENLRVQRSHIIGPKMTNQSLALNISFTIDG